MCVCIYVCMYICTYTILKNVHTLYKTNLLPRAANHPPLRPGFDKRAPMTASVAKFSRVSSLFNLVD